MITVLVLGHRERALELEAAAARNPSMELLHAGDVEEAIDRLARNRRIDAVLVLLGPEAARDAARTLAEEDPAGPPLFVPATAGNVTGTRSLAGATPDELLDSIAREL